MKAMEFRLYHMIMNLIDFTFSYVLFEDFSQEIFTSLALNDCIGLSRNTRMCCIDCVISPPIYLRHCL